MSRIYNLFTAVAICAISLSSPVLANAGNKEKTPERINAAKVWFKDGSVYEGPLVKHWRTHRQTYLVPAHNFHILPDPDGKSVKCQAKDTDSILIISSTHPDFKDGDFYVSFNGKTNALGGRTMHKMLKREHAGKNVDLCKLTYVGNCVRGKLNIDQWMEYWAVRFRDTGRIAMFYANPLQKGCNKAWCFWGVTEIAKSHEALGDALTEKFVSDKETRKEAANAIAADPMVYIDFIDNYISEHPQ